MNFSKEINEINEVTSVVEVLIPIEETQAAYDKAINKVSKSAKLKGFRQGKAPLKMVEKIYGAKTRYEVIDDLVKSSVNSLITDLPNANDLIGPPQIEFVSVVPEEPLSFKATFEYMPRPEIKGYEDLSTLEAPKEESVTEKDVKEAMQNIAENNAETTDVERSELLDGDLVELNFADKIIKKDEESDFPASRKISIVMGSEDFPKEIQSELSKAKVGDSLEFKKKFTKTSKAEHYQGKEVEFKIEVLSTKERKVPEINDDFVKGLKVTGVEDVAAFKEKVKESITSQKQQEAANKKAQSIFDFLLEKNQFSIPQLMIKEQLKMMLSQYTQEEISDQALEHIPDEIKEQAETEVKKSVLIFQIAANENLNATKEDVDSYFEESVQSYGQAEGGEQINADMLKQFYMQQEGAMQKLQSDLTSKRVMEFLEKKAGFAPAAEKPKKAAAKKTAKTNTDKKTAKKSKKTEADSEEKSTSK